jgi:hypothetical protein
MQNLVHADHAYDATVAGTRTPSGGESGAGMYSSRTSFTADSPYYTSFVESEMRQVQVLSQTLQEISARAKTFGKCGALMAEATRRLALACRLKPSNPSSVAGGGGGGPDDDDAKNSSSSDSNEKVLKERQDAVGEEMMMVLSTLGEVRK